MVKRLLKRYFVDAMGAMASGLFASLLIGTIIKAIAMIPGLGILNGISDHALVVSGPAMAVAIAYSLKAHPLVIYSCVYIGYLANTLGKGGGPLAVFFIAIAASEIGMLVSKKTKFDIVVTPLVTVLSGGLLSIFIAPYFNDIVVFISSNLSVAMTWQPFFMGIVVSVVFGMVLTLPISSAALATALLLTGANGDAGLALAGGAAVAGCCAQMVGFAFMSFRENGWGGLVSQGLGTSMLQMPNIVKNPLIWIPPIVASAITGPLATMVFNLNMYSSPVYSGMGTCALLGPIGIVLGWFGGSYPAEVTAVDWIGLILICLVIPAIVSVALGELLRKIKWIKPGDLKLE